MDGGNHDGADGVARGPRGVRNFPMMMIDSDGARRISG